VRCIGGLRWWRFFPVTFVLSLKVSYRSLSAVRNFLKEFCWFGMWLFGSFGELGMIKKISTNLFIMRMFWKESSARLS
jgi:hypothetical protein